MSKRLLLEVLGLWLVWPTVAAAQSFHLQAASLERDGEPVGEVARLSVEVVRWLDGTTARVRHGDEAVTLEADVDLTDARDYLQAGVGADQRLRGTGSWKVTMLRGSWAPVLRGSAEAIRVALPGELPVSWGRLDGEVPGAGAVPEGGPWWAVAGGEGVESAGERSEGQLMQHCPGLTVHSGPSLEEPGWTVPAGIHDIRKVGLRGEWYEVQVRHAGFRLDGFVERSAAGCEGAVGGGLGLGGVGTGCGDGVAGGRVVRLAEGTRLYATADAAEPFATLHREGTGLEPVERTFARACRSEGGVERCERIAIPPLPTGFVRWIVEPEGTEGGMVLTGFVHVPAEELPDQDIGAGSAVGGFGLCSPGFVDWPRPGERPTVSQP